MTDDHLAACFASLEQFARDVRFGVRALRKNPGFAIVAVLTLALGIGANTAIFSVVENAVLAPLPYPQPDRLVRVSESRPNLKQMDISHPDFQDWQRNARSFEQMAALTWREYDLTGPGVAEHLDGMEVSSGFFATLGVKPVLGRDFSPAEDQLHGAPAAIISDRLWQDRFASSPQVLGKSVILDGVDFTIIGVLQPRFHFWTDADVYTLLGQGEPLSYSDRTIHGIAGIARLKPGISIGQAEGELNAVQENLDRLYPAADRNLGVAIAPLKQSIVGNAGGILLGGFAILALLLASVGIYGVISCSVTLRVREIGIRMALGAQRRDVFRMVIGQGLRLALAGLLIGAVGALLLARLLSSFSRLLYGVRTNDPLTFVAVSLVLVGVSVLACYLPARRASRFDPMVAFRCE
jgi:putative ABC transport system permease protein